MSEAARRTLAFIFGWAQGAFFCSIIATQYYAGRMRLRDSIFFGFISFLMMLAASEPWKSDP